MSEIKTGCTHPIKQGDNYGTTCMVCGAQISGYGYWGEFKTCKHVFLKSEDGTYQVCMFCELEIDRPTGEEAIQ